MADSITQLATEVAGYVVPLYPAAPAAGALTWAVGGKSAKGKDSPPRVVWIPLREEYAGPIKSRDATTRPICTRTVSVELHVWAGDLAATELLLQQVLAAVHAATHGSYSLTGAEWVTQDEAQFLTAGEQVNVTVAFELPVLAFQPLANPATATVAPTVAVTPGAFDPAGATPGDGILQAGET